MDGLVDGWMGGWINGWVDGWMDGYNCSYFKATNYSHLGSSCSYILYPVKQCLSFVVLVGETESVANPNFKNSLEELGDVSLS